MKWIKDHGLRGGILLPTLAPDVTWLPPVTDRCYDPLWELCADLGVVVNSHSGTGSPNYGKRPGAAMIQLLEIPYYSQRPLVHLLLSGVFERHPRLKYCLTEIGSAWVVPMLQQLDTLIERVRSGASGEMRYTSDDMPLTMTATEMFHQNCHMGASMAGPADVASRKELGLGAVMWGSDYPHDEGTYPYSLERIRHAFHDVPPEEAFALLCGNAAELYGFEVDKLVPLANQVGPTVADVQVPLAPDEEAKIPRRV